MFFFESLCNENQFWGQQIHRGNLRESKCAGTTQNNSALSGTGHHFGGECSFLSNAIFRLPHLISFRFFTIMS